MRALAWLFLLACSHSPATKQSAPRSSPELNKLMNDEINPTFTKLSTLAFHADTMDDPEAARADLARMAGTFAAATKRLEAWPSPPVRSAEGREVFHTYAASVDRDARKLVTAAETGDTEASRRALERIAETCNNCHHFFRLDIEDSVVGPQRGR